MRDCYAGGTEIWLQVGVLMRYLSVAFSLMARMAPMTSSRRQVAVVRVMAEFCPGCRKSMDCVASLALARSRDMSVGVSIVSFWRTEVKWEISSAVVLSSNSCGFHLIL